ncbi:MAG TPA: ribbon-helix-helix domain-containing protein [Candidatus Desulfaltia sp.]|nr:ribbon-helix-helix domain-containing protein [Candidatus Desulfaltia sp.]
MVPVGYLDRFDAAIKGYYPSRSEAIRQGMGLILREVASMRRFNREPLAPAGPDGKEDDAHVEVAQ